MRFNLFIIMFLFIVGCAQNSARVAEPMSVTPKSRHASTATSLDVESPSFQISSFLYDSNNGTEISEEDLRRIFAKFDVPIAMTDQVKRFIKYFTGPARPTMQRWIDRSNVYMPMVKGIFRREDVSQDLVVLSFTESGFNPVARSRAGAVGMWQFMQSTGRMYDLNVTDWTDERRDFEKSTVAAARHLRDLYEIFDDWYLALAAYNAGSGKVSRAIQKGGTKDFFQIAQQRSLLKKETRDYVPKYLAQLIIYNNMTEYGFSPSGEIPMAYEEVTLSSQVNLLVLADILEYDVELLKSLNPELLTPMTPPVEKYRLRVPAGEGSNVASMLRDKKIDLVRYDVYHAHSGESVAEIASRHGTSTAAVMKLNAISADKMHASKILFVPRTNDVSSSIDVAFTKEIATLAPKYYHVRKGDNMSYIARKCNMPLQTLVKLNPNVRPSRIYPGQVLVISRSGS